MVNLFLHFISGYPLFQLLSLLKQTFFSYFECSCNVSTLFLETKELSTSVSPNKSCSYFTFVAAKKIIVIVTNTLIFHKFIILWIQLFYWQGGSAVECIYIFRGREGREKGKRNKSFKSRNISVHIYPFSWRLRPVIWKEALVRVLVIIP